MISMFDIIANSSKIYLCLIIHEEEIVKSMRTTNLYCKVVTLLYMPFIKFSNLKYIYTLTRYGIHYIS